VQFTITNPNIANHTLPALSAFLLPRLHNTISLSTSNPFAGSFQPPPPPSLPTAVANHEVPPPTPPGRVGAVGVVATTTVGVGVGEKEGTPTAPPPTYPFLVAQLNAPPPSTSTATTMAGTPAMGGRASPPVQRGTPAST
jgi:hypothetical protein